MNAIIKTQVTGAVALPKSNALAALMKQSAPRTLDKPWERYDLLTSWRNYFRRGERGYNHGEHDRIVTAPLPLAITDAMLAKAAGEAMAYLESVKPEEAIAGDRLLRNRYPDWEKLGPNEMKPLTAMWLESFDGFPRILFQEAIRRWFEDAKTKRPPTPGELKAKVANEFSEAREFGAAVTKALQWLEETPKDPAPMTKWYETQCHHWEWEISSNFRMWQRAASNYSAFAAEELAKLESAEAGLERLLADYRENCKRLGIAPPPIELSEPEADRAKRLARALPEAVMADGLA